MPTLTLFHAGDHRNLLLEDFGHGKMVQANQHLIVHGSEGMILDPGGHKVYTKVLGEASVALGRSTLRHIFLSHQDPDIVAALNGWLMSTEAVAHVSALWVRFVPHFGLDARLLDRLKPIPDAGERLSLGGCELFLLPAHFLHSPGNFHVYDPVAKILYTGDLGASLGVDYRIAEDFDEHVKAMEGFHRRYMSSARAVLAWAGLVKALDVETIAPQHGAVLQGRPMVERFLAWCSALPCGLDLFPPAWSVPPLSTPS